MPSETDWISGWSYTNLMLVSTLAQQSRWEVCGDYANRQCKPRQGKGVFGAKVHAGTIGASERSQAIPGSPG